MDLLFCPDSTANFLGLFDTTIAPTLLYYAYIPISIVSVFFGLFVFLKNTKQIQSRLLLALSVAFSLLILNEIVQWIAVRADFVYFGWEMSAFFQTTLVFLIVYFTWVYFKKTNLNPYQKGIMALLYIPVITLLPTHFNMSAFDLINCEGVNGPLWYYIYTLEFLAIAFIAYLAVHYFRKTKEPEARKQIIILSIASIIFLSIFASTNIAGDTFSIYEMNLIGPTGMVLFIAFLSFMMVRFKAFNVKLIGTQALVVAIFTLVFAILFIRQVENVRYVVIATLIVFFFVGRTLIHSVKKEIETKEKVEKLAGQLQRANTGLSEANSRLKELDKQKSEFVSFASHQLRSPMTAMKGYASMIVEGDYGPVPDIIKKPVSIIYESTQTLINIVEDYLNISRIELGTLRYNLANVNLTELAEQVVNEQRPNVEARGLKLNLQFDEAQKYMVAIDKDKFKQILMNLVDNAVKYTPKGSITVELAKGQNSIKYIVKDTGIGIPAEIIPKLFQKWSRADNARTENIKGTGLGLFVAKQMTEAHQGKIWAESEGEGKGSRFIVELPEVK